jgi:glutamate-1-semialdehyde 2,1-aminomutase
MEEWRRHVGRQVGAHRLGNGLFFGMPSRDMSVDDANAFLVGEVARTPGARGLLLVSPRSGPESVAAFLSAPRIAGFKPYPFFSTEASPYDSAPGSFIPEWAWEIAHDRGLVITVHLVRERAIADPVNSAYVREKCARYPRAKLVLAHVGRSFNAANARTGLAMIEGLANVWLDTAVVCEPGPFIQAVRRFGAGKLLWGADFPDSEIRGRCVTIGEGFFWVQPDTVSRAPGYSGFAPVLAGLESLRALLEAADYLGWGRSELAAIFRDNALRMLGGDR